MTITAETTQQIILGAINTTGPNDGTTEDWDVRFDQNLRTITAMIGEGSKAYKTVQMMGEAKKFKGTILGVKAEKTSRRGLVFLYTKPSDFHPDGVESARTEQVDRPEAKALYEQLKSLVGHRVLVFVEMQASDNGGKKFRIIQHIQDLGPDNDFDAEEAAGLVAANLKK